MAQNETHIAAPPEAVWDVLADPYAYPEWVVGSDRTLEADPDWPLPESKFKVRLPLGWTDATHSREMEPNRRIVLDAAGGALGAMRVTILLRPEGDGTHVTLIERPTGPLKYLNLLPPVHLAIKARNVESLRRFKRLAEARAARNARLVRTGS
jgi:uncharacterized protein YndB with AHSA1/START domain